MKDYNTIGEIVHTNDLLKGINTISQEEIKRIMNDLEEYNYRNNNNYTYTNQLYPSIAIDILAFSRSSRWSTGSPDQLMEEIIAAWLKTRVNPDQYFIELFHAIENSGCLDGVYHRLNLMAIMKPEQPNIIKIITKYGSQTIAEDKPTKYKPFEDEDTKNAVKEFLKEKEKFIETLSSVCYELKEDFRLYNLEQSLLAWIGYLVLRIKIDTQAKSNKAITHNTTQAITHNKAIQQ